MRYLRPAKPLNERPDVSLRLREKRLQLNVSQRALARILGVDLATIATAESGLRPPSRKLLAWLDGEAAEESR